MTLTGVLKVGLAGRSDLEAALDFALTNRHPEASERRREGRKT
jgi:hypothetical protein